VEDETKKNLTGVGSTNVAT